MRHSAADQAKADFDAAGRMRLVVEAINVAERVALAAGKPSVAAADLVDYALCQDFNGPVLTARRRATGGLT